MSKKIVIRADLIGSKCKSKVMTTVAKLRGIKSIDIDQDKCTMTVVGTVDPVRVVQKLRKARFVATIVSIEDEKPKEPEKDPCQEACEQACKGNCEKVCSCDEGPWYNGYTPGCYSNPYNQPNSYGYGRRAPALGYVCYEESSPRAGGGQCVIQ